MEDEDDWLENSAEALSIRLRAEACCSVYSVRSPALAMNQVQQTRQEMLLAQAQTAEAHRALQVAQAEAAEREAILNVGFVPESFWLSSLGAAG